MFSWPPHQTQTYITAVKQEIMCRIYTGRKFRIGDKEKKHNENPSPTCETPNHYINNHSLHGETLNDTRGRLSQGCEWLTHTPEKLSQGCESLPNFQADFHQCVKYSSKPPPDFHTSMDILVN